MNMIFPGEAAELADLAWKHGVEKWWPGILSWDKESQRWYLDGNYCGPEGRYLGPRCQTEAAAMMIFAAAMVHLMRQRLQPCLIDSTVSVECGIRVHPNHCEEFSGPSPLHAVIAAVSTIGARS